MVYTGIRGLKVGRERENGRERDEGKRRTTKTKKKKKKKKKKRKEGEPFLRFIVNARLRTFATVPFDPAHVRPSFFFFFFFPPEILIADGVA